MIQQELKFTKHALERALHRGITQSHIDKVIKTPVSITVNKTRRTIYEKDGIAVVVKMCKTIIVIITCYKCKRKL